MRATAIEATRTGPGQRTMAVPMRRQPRVRMARLGSNSPIWLPIVMTAGVRVSDPIRVTSTPRPAGIPRLWKYGVRVKRRQNTAAATVRPEPMITCAVLRYIVK